MGQRRSGAVLISAQALPIEEEFATGMDQRRKDVVLKDAQVNLGQEELAEDMDNGRRSSYAALNDVQTLPNREECAGCMGQCCINHSTIFMKQSKSV